MYANCDELSAYRLCRCLSHCAVAAAAAAFCIGVWSPLLSFAEYSAASSAGGGKKIGLGKQHNTLPFWGNESSMNLNPLILANIQSSSYFKGNERENKRKLKNIKKS